MRAVVIAALPVAAPAFGGGAREKSPQLKELRGLSELAPRVGFEPTTLRLTAGCSAVELPRKNPSGRRGPRTLRGSRRRSLATARSQGQASRRAVPSRVACVGAGPPD